MHSKNFSAQSGVTLVEVLIVLAIMAIIVGFAAAQFGTSRENFQRQSIARELKVSLERARFDSVKRRPETEEEMSRVVIETPTSFTVYLDFNQDGVISPDTEKREVDFGYTGGIRIVGRDLVFPVTVRFDRRGHITVDGTGANIVPVFTICDKDCTFETANASNSNLITVSQTGTVTMTFGGEPDITFSNPTVSNVSPCERINDWVTVVDTSMPAPDCNAPNPTPSPTPSPTTSPSPSGSPTPTPTPTPTPQPTATPQASPSLPVCKKNDRPGNPPTCMCVLPMTVKQNGKCM